VVGEFLPHEVVGFALDKVEGLSVLILMMRDLLEV
jgi:hypothetical protein